MGMSIGELFIQLGFEKKDATLGDFLHALGDLNLRSVASVYGLDKLYDAIQHIMSVADKTATGMYAFNSQTGMSAQKMQQWSSLARQMGLDAGEVVSTVKTLQDSVARMKLTGEGAGGWMLLGIDPNKAKDSFELLSMIREALKRLSPEYQRLALQQIGVSDSMLSMLKVSDEMWKSTEKNIANTDKQVEALMKVHAAQQKLAADWEIFLTDVGEKMAPAFEKIAKVLDWFVLSTRKNPLQGIVFSNPTAYAGIAAWTGILERLANVWGKITGNSGLSGIFPGFQGSLAPGMAAGGSVTSTKSIGSVKFEIVSNNPEETARKVESTLQRMFSDGEYQTRQ